MSGKKINEIMEGCALLECCGNLYEYIGNNRRNKMLFQNVNDDSYLRLSYEELRTDQCYDICY